MMDYDSLVIRRDILEMLKSDKRLTRNDKLLFLALAAEIHGMPYSTIDRQSIEDNWGIKRDMWSASMANLEKFGYIIQIKQNNKYTKEKSIAKYVKKVDGGFIPAGHRVIQSSVTNIPDQFPILRLQGGNNEEDADIPVMSLDIPDNYAAIPSQPADIPSQSADIPFTMSGMSSQSSDIPSGTSDIPHKSSDIPSLIRKEEKEKIRRENKGSLSHSSSSPAKGKKLETVIKEKFSQGNYMEKDALRTKSLIKLGGSEEALRYALDQLVVDGGYYSDYEDELRDIIRSSGKQKTNARRTEIAQEAANLPPVDIRKFGIEPNDWWTSDSNYAQLLAYCVKHRIRFMTEKMIENAQYLDPMDRGDIIESILKWEEAQ